MFPNKVGRDTVITPLITHLYLNFTNSKFSFLVFLSYDVLKYNFLENFIFILSMLIKPTVIKNRLLRAVRVGAQLN